MRCWIAPRDVRPGALYSDAIVRRSLIEILLVVLVAKWRLASSHVGREVERGVVETQADHPHFA